jgi:hypothetical protein
MFDPSIFLHRQTLQAVREELESSGDQAYVPARFLTVASSSFIFDPTSPGVFFGTEGESEQVSGAFRDWAWDRYLVPYEAPDHPDEDDEVGHALLRLEGVDDDVRRILFEEWWYLQHESWIKTAKDACANAFEKAGAVAYKLGADAFNAFVDKAESVPELLKKPGVRKAGKWTLAAGVGIGTEAALLVFFPPAAGIVPGLLFAHAGTASTALTKLVLGGDKRKGFLKLDP